MARTHDKFAFVRLCLDDIYLFKHNGIKSIQFDPSHSGLEQRKERTQGEESSYVC